MGKSNVRNNIRTLRFHSGEMTQQALADKVGVTRQTVVAIEGAKYSPSLELAFRIAIVFGVPLEDVFRYRPGDTTKSPGLSHSDRVRTL